MNKDLFDKVKETARNLVSSVRRFGDGKIMRVPPKEKHIAGEQEFPGEMVDPDRWKQSDTTPLQDIRKYIEDLKK